jgi:O-antigen/teichoic acid export membrane protein
LANVEEISPPAPSLSRRVSTGMLWSQSGRIVEVAITFGTAVFVVRGLNPTGFGTYSLLTNLAGAASVFIPVLTTESLGAVFPRFASRNERVFMTLVVGALRVLVLVATTIVVLTIWGRVASTIGIGGAPRSYLLLAGGYWLAQDLLNTVVGYYGAELDMRPVAVWRTSGLAATFVAIVVLAATNEFSVPRVLAVVASGYALALVGLAFGLRKVGRPKAPPTPEIRYALAFTRSIWLIGVLSFTLATQIDVLLIGALTGDRRQAAFYATAVGVVLRVQLLLVSGWAALIIPTFGHAFTTGGLPRLRRVWRRSAELWLLISLPLNALLLANAGDVIGLLFGTPYLVSTRLLQWVCAFNLGAAMFANPSCIGALWAADRQRLLARFRIVTAGLNIGLAFALIPPYGALGAVIATGVAAVAGGAVEFELSRRLGVNDYPTRVAAAALVAAALAMVPGFLIVPTNAPQLLASGGLGVVLFLGALVAAKPLRQSDAAAATAVHPRLGELAVRLFVRR